MALTIPRVSRIPSGAGCCQAGAAEVDLTPDPGLDMAGYSAMAQEGQGARGRLMAHALYLEDAQGEQLALVWLDLMSASRFLFEAVAAETASFGVDAQRLVLAGTHTHTGPGHFYGNRLYDLITAHLELEDWQVDGFDQVLARWLVGRIAAAVRQAFDARRPALLATVDQRLWGMAHQATPWTFEANQEHHRWCEPGWPGSEPPPGLGLRQRLVDPRVRVIAAFEEDGTPLGALATFSCHATALGHRWDLYSPDWPGWARRRARQLLGSEVVVGLAGGASGDQTPMREGDEPPRGAELAAVVGEAVGEAIATAVQAAEPDPAWTIRSWLCDWWPSDEEVEGRPDTLLAPWTLGTPSLCGAHEAPSGVRVPALGITNPHADDSFDPDDPRFPKSDLREVQGLLELLLDLQPAPTHPLHLVRLGDHALATIPGEPTVTTAWRLEQLLCAHPELHTAAVVGYAGDYTGYHTTREEYRCQHYEAGSQIYGRNQAAHVRALYAHLLHQQASQLRPQPDFQVYTATTHHPWIKGPPHLASPQHATLVRDGARLRLRWELPRKHPLGLHLGPVARVLREQGDDWVSVVVDGLPLDEATWLWEVRRARPFLGPDHWTVEGELPTPELVAAAEAHELAVELVERPWMERQILRL